MTSNHIPTVSRRNVLQGLGAAGMVGLAGCAGGGGGGGDGGDGGSDSGGSSDGGGGGKTGTASDSGKAFSNVSFNYWNIVNIQNRNARELSQKIVKEFEEETGARVRVNYSGYSDLVGSKWRTVWGDDNYPVMYDSLTYLAGHLNHKAVPVSEYMDMFDQEVIGKYKWLLDFMSKHTYRGYEGSGMERVYEVPFGLDARQPNIFRKDHFDQAGVSLKDVVPWESYDELVNTMKTVMNNGPADTGYQVYGANHDWSDVNLIPWQLARNGSDGLYLDEKAASPNFTNDGWIETFRDYVNVYREHGLCGKRTPTMSDEKTVPNIIGGNWSGGAMDAFNHPSMLRQAKSLTNSGKIQYTSQIQSDKLPKGGFIWSMGGLALTKKPPNADKAKWKRKQEAAVGLMQKFLTADKQRKSWKGFGTLPARKDVWSDLKRQPHGLLDQLTSFAEETKYSISARPGMGKIYSTLNGPIAQKALRGDITPEKACKQMQKQSKELMSNKPFPSER